MAITVPAVQELLNSDLSQATRLAELLKAERQQLEQRDSEKLRATVEAKLLLLQDMEKNEITRRNLIQLNGHKDDPITGWSQLLDELQPNNDNHLQSTWAKIKTQLAECEKLNQINNKIVNRTQKSVGRLLSILKGQNEPAEVYSKKGQTQRTGNRRSLAQV